MTKIFFDTEFTGLHQKTTLISIGLISESGETFYAEFNDYDYKQIDDWIESNVLSKLIFRGDVYVCDLQNHRYKGSAENIKTWIQEWINQFDKVEMWSDCLAYDWVLFCQLFGHAFNIPKNIYYIPFDICTLFNAKGIDADISLERFVKEIHLDEAVIKHNALYDALIIKSCYEKLQTL